MIEEQRVQLAKELLRKEWGKEFRDSDVIGIFDYCMDEATISVAMGYEMKYGLQI